MKSSLSTTVRSRERLRAPRLLLLLALVGGALSVRAEPDVPPEAEFRVLAVERGPAGDLVWVESRDGSSFFSLTVGQVLPRGEVRAIDWESGIATVRFEKKDPKRRLLRPYLDRELAGFSTLRSPLFGDSGCPLFLDRVEVDAAWVRTGAVGEERELRLGDELCGGWVVDEFQAGTAERVGRFTLRKGERRLKVAAAYP